MPRIGITMGDPRGVGPEVTRAALAALGPVADWVVYGDPALYPGVEAELVPPSGAVPERDAIEQAAEALRIGAVDAVVTGPVCKSRCFGSDFPGHTELFATRLGADDIAMMMFGPRLTVVPLTIHVPLRDVPRLLTTAEVLRIGRLTHRALRDQLGVPSPRVAVAGLNPHAGDDGLFGDEEARVLAPAIAALRAEGVDATGPWSPDTVYHHALEGRFDVVLGAYHDQALVPFKLVHFSDGVNVTLGLPRPRTSPDHGPALDIAGTGAADPTSMRRAIELACRMTRTDTSGPTGAP